MKVNEKFRMGFGDFKSLNGLRSKGMLYAGMPRTGEFLMVEVDLLMAPHHLSVAGTQNRPYPIDTPSFALYGHGYEVVDVAPSRIYLKYLGEVGPK